jgi:hypothetical protein
MQSRRFFSLVCTALVAISPSTAFAQNVDMGATFDAISSTAIEVETTFRDARAVTRRQGDGRLETVLYDLAGNVLVTLTRTPSRPFIDVGVPDGRWRHRVQLPPQASLAADWNNAQVWQLWRDARASDTDLAAPVLPPVAMRGKRLRIGSVHDAETRTNQATDVDDEIMSVQTRFPKYVALSTKKEGRTLRPDGVYATFTSRLQSVDGVTLGYIRFFKKERIVSWTFGNGERGVAREENVKGGFKFTPNMAWANVQAVRFHEHPPAKPVPASAFANQISSCAAGVPPLMPAKTTGAATTSQAGASAGASIKNRVLSWFGGVRFLPSRSISAAANAPTRSTAGIRLPFGGGLGTRSATRAAGATAAGVAAVNPCDGVSDGCTGLHWLDGTVFRPCCDKHDECFEKDCDRECNKWSWIKLWERWDCVACNVAAILCFVTVNGGGGGSGGGGGGGGGGDWCWSDLDCPDGYTCEWDGRCQSWF